LKWVNTKHTTVEKLGMAHLPVFALGTKADKRITGLDKKFEHRDDSKDGARWREMDLCGADDYGQILKVSLGFWHVEVACESRRSTEDETKVTLRSNTSALVPP
jgi:hypothetical protein